MDGAGGMERRNVKNTKLIINVVFKISARVKKIYIKKKYKYINII
jgi:hypothetical protein